MVSITPLSSITAIGSTTTKSENRSQGDNFPPKGQLLKAMVLEAKGENRFLLEISGNQLTAKSSASLSPGQRLQLQVIQTSPEIQLKIVSDTLSQFLGKSLTLLGDNINLKELFQAFQNVSPPPLGSLTPPSRNAIENFFSLQQQTISDKDGGSILKQLIDRLGLSLENALANGDKGAATSSLKAALLEIATVFQNSSSIADAADKILTTLELFQLAQLHTNSEKQFIFPLPLPFIDQGYLVVDRENPEDEGENGNKKERRFSLHLTMSELGNIQIDFLSDQETLYIRFRIDSQEKADFVSQFSQQLEDAITDIENINISFSTDAPDPIADLMRQIVPEGNFMLDTKA